MAIFEKLWLFLKKNIKKHFDFQNIAPNKKKISFDCFLDVFRDFSKSSNVQTLTTDRAKPKIDGGFTCLKQIQTDCEDSSVQVNYYNLCAYLTELKADKIMYKACPTEKCNKMVNDVGPGSFKCEKFRQEFPEFQWRYIVRGAIADATSYQVIMNYVPYFLN